MDTGSYMVNDHDDELLEPEEMDYLTDYSYEAEDRDYFDDSSSKFDAGGLNYFSFKEIIQYCVEPNISDGLQHLGKLVLWCIIFRLTSQFVRPSPWLCHMFSIGIGCIVLWHFFYFNVFFMLGLMLLTYLVLMFSNNVLQRWRGSFIAITCVVYNITCEFLLTTSSNWHQIRGAQMILSMKVISLAFDIKDEALRSLPNILAFSGYCLCPANCVLGPWVKYSEYLNIYVRPRWNGAWAIKICFNMIFAFMFLTISTCWNNWFIPDDSWRWWLAYRDAMSFRASHYFVSFISEATSIASGFGSTDDRDFRWSFQVTHPHRIEFPRSLVEVVIAWNIPMHKWLKTYCFKTMLPFGTLAAVATTYMASSILHGLSFQLAAVLFSLGFYSFIEHKIRRKLSKIFSASVDSRFLNQNEFFYKDGHVLVVIVNLAFTLLAIFHLSYLGVMFDQQPMEIQADGYSWRHTLSKWAHLGFKSHIVAFVMFILTFII